MDISNNGSTVENGASLTGNPAVTISGDGVTFVNKSGGSVLGYAAIVIRGSGTTIVNEAGATIRGAPDGSGYRFLAIDGSEHADTIINSGRIVNDVNLHGGEDHYEIVFSDENNVLGNPIVDLGSGDDLAVFHVGGISTLWGADIEGGEGYDTLRLEGIKSTYISTNVLYSVEKLVLIGSGEHSFASTTYGMGMKEIWLSKGLTFTLGGRLSLGSPDAQVFLEGGRFDLESTAGSVIGSDAGERLEVYGALIGGAAMGGGDDYVLVEGSVGGGIDLGAGNDIFDFNGTEAWVSYGDGTSAMTYDAPGTVAGLVDGGAGDDELSLFAIDGRTFDFAAFANFESASIAGRGGDVRLKGVDVASITIQVSGGTRIAIGDTAAPELELALGGYPGQSEIVVESTATIGGITRTIPLDIGDWGPSSDYGMIVGNAGTIIGDVHLWLGNDRYDGQLGSVGGTVFGHSGDDTILLGAGDDEASGGRGADILEGHGGADTLNGGADDDVLRGGGGGDRLDGGAGRDALHGGDGDDVLIDSEGSGDSLYGEGGDDVIELLRGFSYPATSFTLSGGDGDDRIRFGTGYNNHVDVDAGDGADVVAIVAMHTANIRLGDGADSLFLDEHLANGAFANVRVLDFTPGEGGDLIDLADRPLLRKAFEWDGTADLFAAGLLRLVQVGPDAHLMGKVNYWEHTSLVVLADTDATALTAANFGGWTPVVAPGAAGGPSVLAGVAGRIDHLAGGRGDDLYLVNDSGDRIAEREDEGQADEARTALAAYTLPDEVEILTATSDDRHDFRGNKGDNLITGGGGNDFLRLYDGGDDSAYGGAGNDVILFGAAVSWTDFVNGGEGTDQLVLQGHYVDGTALLFGGGVVGIENIAILPGDDTRFGDPGTHHYDYKLTLQEATVAPGVQLVVDANRLRAGEDLTFDGSAETDGSFFVYGGGGTDILFGGANNDVFLFGAWGQWNPADVVVGGSGIDQLALRGNYSLTFGAGQLFGIENIGLLSAHDTRFGTLGSSYSYDLTMVDGNVASGLQMTVDGAKLRVSEFFRFDGSAELDGSFRVFGGLVDDTIVASRNNDFLQGNGGMDTLTGGEGADIFRYLSASDSAPGAADEILDFTPGTDKIDLSRIDANSQSAGDQAFSWIGSNLFTGSGAASAGELRAYQSGQSWFVEGDTDGDGDADLLIDLLLAGPTPLGSGDFVA
jgi:Ca2+-binding RTX toxin-like protein